MDDIKIIQMHITELKLRNQLKSGDLEVALTRAISALEKQIPEKPFCDTIYRQISFITVEKEDIFTCKCNNTVCKKYRYCPFCGQKLDWSDL